MAPPERYEFMEPENQDSILVNNENPGMFVPPPGSQSSHPSTLYPWSQEVFIDQSGAPGWSYTQ
jgi:hypothetical protein